MPFNNYRIVVILEDKIYVYNFQTLTLQEKFDTCPNSRGVCAMNGSKDMCVLATPTTEVGIVKLIHFDRAGKTLTVKAHLTTITALALNNDGTLLATASDSVNIR